MRGDISKKIQTGIIKVLEAGNGVCLPRDILSAIYFSNEGALTKYLIMLESKGIIIRHNQRRRSRVFISLAGKVDVTAAPAPMSQSVLKNLNIESPWSLEAPEAGLVPVVKPQASTCTVSADDRHRLLPGYLMSLSDIDRLYAGRRYSDKGGKELMSNYVPSRPAAHVPHGGMQAQLVIGGKLV